jgi:hypothetical protein
LRAPDGVSDPEAIDAPGWPARPFDQLYNIPGINPSTYRDALIFHQTAKKGLKTEKTGPGSGFGEISGGRL